MKNSTHPQPPEPRNPTPPNPGHCESIGLDRLRCLHVNDAKAELGSNRDRHANLLEGELGEQLRTFLTHPAFAGLPAILETPGAKGKGADAAEVAKLRELAGSSSSRGGIAESAV